MSLDNVITLSVDEDGDGQNPVDYEFRRGEEAYRRTVYNGEDFLPEARDTLTFYLTPAKPSGNFKGVTKVTQKFTKDVIVTGVDGLAQITAPIIAEISWSLPIGIDAAARMLARQRVIALISDSVLMEDIMAQLQY